MSCKLCKKPAVGGASISDNQGHFNICESCYENFKILFWGESIRKQIEYIRKHPLVLFCI